jgi:spore maturation protein CgeB
MNNKKPVLIYIGNGNKYTRSFMRFKALNTLDYNIYDKSHQPVNNMGLIEKPKIITRILHRLRLHRDSVGVNKWLLQKVRQKDNIDFIWIDGATNIYPWVLSKLKRINSMTTLIFFSEDDIMARHNSSHWFKLGLHNYDFVFTTKKFNINELKSIGASQVELISDSYCEEIHHPITLTSKEKKIYLADVSAIGAYEQDRYESLLYIAKKGIKVKVWGGGWEGCANKHPNLNVRNEFLYNEDYSKAIRGSKINLNFLRKMNRDTITSRSVEIPACRGFMLAERTDSQKELFIEGVEADYFSSDEELLEKIKFYIANDAKRIKVAENGFNKCIDSKVSMKDVIYEVIGKNSSSQK